MSRQRLLYLDTDRLTAYCWQAGRLTEEAAFESSAQASPRFSAYLQTHRHSHFSLLANAGEEAYRLETIPFLRGANRQALISRKIAQHFHHSPLAASISLGFEKAQRKNEKLLLSALTQPEHLAPWLQCIKETGSALAGIYSVAQLAGTLLKKLHLPARRSLLLSVHGHSLRETYLVDGETRFSRMAPLLDISSAGIAGSIADEAARLQQYLVSQRLIERNEALPVYVLAPAMVTTAVREACRESNNLRFEILDSQRQAPLIGLKSLPGERGIDLLFLHLLRIAPPRQQLANEDHRHDYRLSQIRRGLLALGVIALLGSALFAARRSFETQQLREEHRSLIAREAETQQRYHELAATFPPVGIDSETLRRVTARHDELAAQQQQPDAAYRMVSKALEQSPAIQLESLNWQIAMPAPAAGRAASLINGGDQVISVHGSIDDTADAGARQVLSRLEQFAAHLRADRNNQVDIRQQPFDIEPGRALRGSDKDDDAGGSRQFTLQVSRRERP
jgi:hypothetical protein